MRTRVDNRPGPLLIVLSGPSGVGKDAVLARMRERGRPLYCLVTVTTRPRRQSEQDGRDYRFVSPERFQEMLKRGEFLEWATVYGNWYGVPRQDLKKALSRGQDAIVKVDVQGAATIKGLLPEAVFIFLAPPSLEELEQRLRARQTESTPEIEVRLSTARREMNSVAMFDYIVVNHQEQVDGTISQIEAIITAERCRVRPRVVEL